MNLIRIGAGLPEIYGYVACGANYDMAGHPEHLHGAFSSPGLNNLAWHYGITKPAWSWASIEFHASKHDSIYGNSATVRPASCECVYILKY